jgi:hypothetical protein
VVSDISNRPHHLRRAGVYWWNDAKSVNVRGGLGRRNQDDEARITTSGGGRGITAAGPLVDGSFLTTPGSRVPKHGCSADDPEGTAGPSGRMR